MSTTFMSKPPKPKTVAALGTDTKDATSIVGRHGKIYKIVIGPAVKVGESGPDSGMKWE